jgi:hypothetical protein
MGNIRRYGAGRVPHSGKLLGHFVFDQPRDWRGRWVTSRGVVKNDKGKRVPSALGTSRAYKLYNPANASKRGVGISGLKRNTVPYARFSTSGTTLGFNAGTIIPGFHRRIVFGGYGRVEHEDMYARQKVASNVLLARSMGGTVVRRFFGGQAGLAPQMNKYMSRAQKAAVRQGPKGLAEVLAGKRMDINGGKLQARFTSTRKYNPTITIRRGRHKVSSNLSHKGSVSFARHIEVLNQKRDRSYKPRPARRKAAKKRVR